MAPLFQWNWTAMEPKSSSSLTMPGEETGLGALASPLAGYLGKVQERVASLENCPWCCSKGLTHALRSYRINLQESITLCTNPQCLFPLVSCSLEDVLASLQPTASSKRKNDAVPGEEESIEPLKKRLRSSADDSHGLTRDSDVNSPLVEEWNGPPCLETNGPPCVEPNVPPCVETNGPVFEEPNGPPCVEPNGPPCVEPNGVEPNGPPCVEPNGVELNVPPCVELNVPPCVETNGPVFEEPNGPPCVEPNGVEPNGPPCVEPNGVELNVPPCVETNGPVFEEPNGPPCVEPNGVEPNGPPCVEPNGPPCVEPNGPPCVEPNGPPCVEPNGPPCVEPNGPPCVEPNGPPCVETNGPPCVEPNGPPCVEPNVPPCVEPNGPPCVEPNVPPCVEPNVPPCVDRQTSRGCSEDVGLSPEVFLLSGENGRATPSPQCREASLSERPSPPEVVDSSNNLCSAVENNDNSFDKDDEIKQEEKPLTHVHASVPESPSGDEAEDSVRVPERLFWRNTDNLCWLNSLLTAVVNCRSLREREAQPAPQQSEVGTLIKDYGDICAGIEAHQHTGTDGVIRVSKLTLQKANEDLESLRMNIFQLLKPKLKCRLGQRGSPVFAMPLLLTMDPWAQGRFQSDFTWEFKCSKCNYANDERITKTLSSVTNLIPDWRPLNAVHGTSCNKCRSRKQQRTMKLDRLPSVFALHFVKGLPDNDVGVYSFDLNKERYSVTTVIQYKQRLRHFVTWTRNADGSWWEYDDLNHPLCKSHLKLTVPPAELHVLFWEAAPSDEPRVCSPSSTFTDPAPERLRTNPVGEEASTCSPDQSLLTPQDSDILHALSPSEHDDDVTNATADASIGTTTLLDTFEGLTHSDIITLTLVELNADTETQTSNGNHATPDSSSSAPLAEKKSHNNELPTLSISSDSESPDNSSSDPTFVPSAAKGKAAATLRQRAKKAAAAASPELMEAVSAIVASPAVKIIDPLKASLVTSPLSSAGKTRSVPEGRWSYLLSKHPAAKVTKANSVRPLFSTPKPVKSPHVPPAISYAKKLRTDDSGSLPLKAAEMYGAFRARNPPKPVQPITTNTPTNVAAASAKRLPEITADVQSAKPPLGLGSTDALRYKLLKKLKAKKKKLAKLSMLLGDEGEVSLCPDSTDLGSPSTVSSSTYDDFLSDLLSPATTASHRSPDSTQFLEMLANGQDGANQLDSIHGNVGANEPSGENFLEEFLSQAAAHKPTDMETEALNALELFL